MVTQPTPLSGGEGTNGTDALCEITELPRPWCGHCTAEIAARHERERMARNRRAQAQKIAGDLTEQLGNGEYRVEWGAEIGKTIDDLIVAVFAAQYPGSCDDCYAHISPGDTIGKTVDGDYVCMSCVEDLRSSRR